MTSLTKKFFVKKIGAIVLVLGTLFAGTAASTFAQGRYYHDGLSGGQKAAVISGATAGGAIIGALAGGGRGALIGGLIGAGAGTAVAVTANHDRYGYARNDFSRRDDFRFRRDNDRFCRR